MAQLWIRDAGGWAVAPLDGTRLAMAGLPGAAPIRGAAGRAMLLRPGADDRGDWHLLAAPASGIAVNGLPLSAGLRVLADRDELQVPGSGTLYFSTERLARIEPLPALSHEVPCPRCRQPIATGTPAVRCPGCEVWHHGVNEPSCWSYAPTCALCEHSTAADAGFTWTPEGL